MKGRTADSLRWRHRCPGGNKAGSGALREWVPPPLQDQRAGLPGSGDLASQLGVLDGAEDLLEERAGRIAHRDEVLAGHKRGRAELLLGIRLQLLPAELVIVEEAVAPEAVEAMELQVEREIGHPQKPLQPVRPHLADIHEEHMAPDEGADGLRLLPGEAEPGEDRGGDLLAPPVMAVEMDAGGILEAGLRLPDVVQQGPPGETRIGARRQEVEHPQGVFPDIPLGMEHRGLPDAPEGRHLRKGLGDQAAFGEEFHAAARPAAHQDFAEFVPDPLGADPPDGGGLTPDGREGRLIDRKIERGREADGPEHPQVILGESLLRIADRPDKTPLDVAAPLHMIDDPARLRIHEEAVHGEIAPADILLGRRKGDPGGAASVIVIRLRPVGRHFVAALPLADDDDAEAGAHGDRPGEEGPEPPPAGPR